MACKAFHQETLDEDGEEGDDGSVSPKVVGHNIYILCHQLALYNKEIGTLLRTGTGSNAAAASGTTGGAMPEVQVGGMPAAGSGGPAAPDPKMVEALRFYNSHTAQIEVVRYDRTLEQVCFFFCVA